MIVPLCSKNSVNPRTATSPPSFACRTTSPLPDRTASRLSTSLGTTPKQKLNHVRLDHSGRDTGRASFGRVHFSQLMAPCCAPVHPPPARCDRRRRRGLSAPDGRRRPRSRCPSTKPGCYRVHRADRTSSRLRCPSARELVVSKRRRSHREQSRSNPDRPQQEDGYRPLPAVQGCAGRKK